MPFILPHSFNNSAIENLNVLVEKYKHVIENDANARCMVGFAAASIIRNEDTMDLDSVESWLQSLESSINIPSEECNPVDDGVDKILHVLKDITTKYRYDDKAESNTSTDEEDEEDSDDDEFDSEANHSLHRYISRGVYTSITTDESYPTHVYVPDTIYVNHSFDDIYLPTKESC